jgi:hypothetical protein
MSKAALDNYLSKKTNIKLISALSVMVGLLMTLISGSGMLFPDYFYPDPRLIQGYLANDPVNILLGLPLFIVALILLRRGKLFGLLSLPGALIYVIYNYIGYFLGRAWDWIAFSNLGLVILSLITLFLLLREINHLAVMARLAGRVGEKLSGWILVFFGLAFIALAISTIITGIQEGTIPPLGENAVSVADIVVSLGWVAGGYLLLRKKPLGFTLGFGLLIAASFLFIGLVLYFFFANLLAGRSLDWAEVITVLAMGLVCFIPTGIFWRGIIESKSSNMVEE